MRSLSVDTVHCCFLFSKVSDKILSFLASSTSSSRTIAQSLIRSFAKSEQAVGVGHLDGPRCESLEIQGSISGVWMGRMVKAKMGFLRLAKHHIWGALEDPHSCKSGACRTYCQDRPLRYYVDFTRAQEIDSCHSLLQHTITLMGHLRCSPNAIAAHNH